MKIKRERLSIFIIRVVVLFLFLSGCGGMPEYMEDNQAFIRITFPVDGSTVSGIVMISAEVPNNENISRVTLYVDGYQMMGRSEDYVEPYEFDWDTTFYENGSHTIVARAYDSDDTYIDSNPVSLTLNNTTEYF